MSLNSRWWRPVCTANKRVKVSIYSAGYIEFDTNARKRGVAFDWPEMCPSMESSIRQKKTKIVTWLLFSHSCTVTPVASDIFEFSGDDWMRKLQTNSSPSEARAKHNMRSKSNTRLSSFSRFSSYAFPKRAQQLNSNCYSNRYARIAVLGSLSAVVSIVAS